MSKQMVTDQEVCDLNKSPDEAKRKKSTRRALALSIAGIILTVVMFVAIIVFNEEVKEMQKWGYVGAFFISILGGATIIIGTYAGGRGRPCKLSGRRGSDAAGLFGHRRRGIGALIVTTRDGGGAGHQQ